MSSSGQRPQPRHATRAREFVDELRGSRTYTDLSVAMGRAERTVSDMVTGRSPSTPNEIPDMDRINELSAVLPAPAGLLVRLFALDRGMREDQLEDLFSGEEWALLTMLGQSPERDRVFAVIRTMLA
jgi:hypothetical protein